jgi:hypothetical protein
MSDKTRIIESISLPNGLQAEFVDFSRRVAGDRWLVGFDVRIPIKVEEKDFLQFDNSSEVMEKFLSSHGDTVFFEIKRERNFIDEKEKDDILEDMLKKVKQHMLEYMGHADFAKGVKREKLKEFEERLHWYPDDN